MRSGRSRGRRSRWAAVAALVVLGLAAAAGAGAATERFEDTLARVDKALRTNPKRVNNHALLSCQNRRNYAAQLYAAGELERAQRSLRYCFHLLEIPERERPKARDEDQVARSMQEIEEQAARELEQALALEPDLKHGLEIYRECALCHMPEGWGLSGGGVPQIAGQHHTVLVKQLADIRAGNRDAFLMIPYASADAIGGAQAVADVTGYIDTLEITVENGKGSGEDLELGERLYRENCARCHGPNGEGDEAKFIPRIQAQHYHYLVRQFEWIRDGKRRNADPEMVAQIQAFEDRELRAVLDYVSRLQPPPELQAPAGWHNPDFLEKKAETGSSR